METVLAQRFVMFDYLGVSMYLYMDVLIDGREEGRIIVKYFDDTLFRVDYSGQAEKNKNIIMGLEICSETMYDVLKYQENQNV